MSSEATEGSAESTGEDLTGTPDLQCCRVARCDQETLEPDKHSPMLVSDSSGVFFHYKPVS